MDTSHVKLLSADHIYDSQKGRFVNEHHERIANVLKDYNPHLSLSYSPDLDTGAASSPFFVGFSDPNKGAHIVMWLRADEINETLLARIWAADSHKNDPLAYLEKLEDAKKAIQLRKNIEEREEAKDIAKFMLRSPLHTMRLDKNTKVNG